METEDSSEMQQTNGAPNNKRYYETIKRLTRDLQPRTTMYKIKKRNMIHKKQTPEPQIESDLTKELNESITNMDMVDLTLSPEEPTMETQDCSTTNSLSEIEPTSLEESNVETPKETSDLGGVRIVKTTKETFIPDPFSQQSDLDGEIHLVKAPQETPIPDPFLEQSDLGDGVQRIKLTLDHKSQDKSLVTFDESIILNPELQYSNEDEDVIIVSDDDGETDTNKTKDNAVTVKVEEQYEFEEVEMGPPVIISIPLDYDSETEPFFPETNKNKKGTTKRKRLDSPSELNSGNQTKYRRQGSHQSTKKPVVQYPGKKYKKLEDTEKPARPFLTVRSEEFLTQKVVEASDSLEKAQEIEITTQTSQTKTDGGIKILPKQFPSTEIDSPPDFCRNLLFSSPTKDVPSEQDETSQTKKHPIIVEDVTSSTNEQELLPATTGDLFTVENPIKILSGGTGNEKKQGSPPVCSSHSIEMQAFACDVCNNIFTSRTNYAVHKLLETKDKV